MKNQIFKITIAFFAAMFVFTSCMKDLDLTPKYGLNSESVYADAANYKHVLAKLYGGLSLTGNKGPAGSADIADIDEGFSNYVRVYWNLQELTSDEAICGWNDPGIPDLNKNQWNANNPWIKGMYYRIYFQITLANEFIRECGDDKLGDRGFSETERSTIVGYKNEAKFLRALSYYHLLELFGTGPFVTEADLPGSYFPQQISKSNLFNYVESELLAIESLLPVARSNEYGRADAACVQTLLAKLYLNASVFNGSDRNNDAVTYCNKVISSGYSLQNSYPRLFMTDNQTSNEIIFPVTSDGLRTQSYGVTTFLVHASIGGTMTASDYGVNGGWLGLRAKKNLPLSFGNDTLENRYLFYSSGQSLEITSTGTFTQGYAVTKWKNTDSVGTAGSDPTGNFVDTDFPMFRLADVYLMYAEATLRGGNGSAATALQYVNDLRVRAGTTVTPSIDLDYVLAERARELFWEGYRRTDLIRYGKYTGGNYLWPFKGGDANGISIDAHYSVFPIPTSDIIANPNLVQNTGY